VLVNVFARFGGKKNGLECGGQDREGAQPSTSDVHELQVPLHTLDRLCVSGTRTTRTTGTRSTHTHMYSTCTIGTCV